MTKEGYKNRIKLYLKRKGVKASAADIKAVVDANYGVNPASQAVKSLFPKPTTRKKAREEAASKFQRVLEETCVVFKKDIKDVDTGEGDDFRDLHSAAAHIALNVLKIRPAVVVSDALGLLSPAAAYHKAYRAEKLIAERVLFAEAVDKIIKEVSK